jgi:hypothetical protein
MVEFQFLRLALLFPTRARPLHSCVKKTVGLFRAISAGESIISMTWRQ